MTLEKGLCSLCGKRTIGGSLPDINFGMGEGFARVGARNLTVHEGDLSVARGIKGDCGAILANGRVGAPEGPEDGARGRGLPCFGGGADRNVVDEAGNRKKVRHLKVCSGRWEGAVAYDSRPSTSHMSWPSLRRSLLIWPAQLIMLTPASHSSIVRSVSRAKS